MTINLKYLVLSDIHLGHKHNTTKEIIANLTILFMDKRLSGLQMIFIAGDLFDKQLVFGDPQILDILRWLEMLFKFCEKNKVALRVLKGTGSHDWDQPFITTYLSDNYGDRVDFAYYDKISIEKNVKFGVDILYVPDEACDTTTETKSLVQKLLESNNLDSVHISIMHGVFGFQIPQNKNMNIVHDEIYYSQITIGLIHIGHDHTRKSKGKIKVQGAFDRLTHGQEERKGCDLTTVKNGVWRVEFMENKSAKVFATFDTSDHPPELVVAKLRNSTNGLRFGSYIKIVSSNDVVLKQFPMIRKMFSDYVISCESSRSKDKAINGSLFEHNDDDKGVILTEENIKPLLLKIIPEKYDICRRRLDILNEILK